MGCVAYKKHGPEAKMAQGKKKRGPRGGIKHQSGRDHDRKSKAERTKRFQRKAKRRREALKREAYRQWSEWDGLSDDAKKLEPEKRPEFPRPPRGID